VENPGVLEMEVEAEKSDCIDMWNNMDHNNKENIDNMWNYSFLKEYRRELDGGLRFFWKIMRPVLNMNMRKPRAESQS